MGTSRKLTSQAPSDNVRANPRQKDNPSTIKGLKKGSKASVLESSGSGTKASSLQSASKQGKMSRSTSCRRHISISKARTANKPTNFKESNPAKRAVLKKEAQSRTSASITAVIRPDINQVTITQSQTNEVSAKVTIIKPKLKESKVADRRQRASLDKSTPEVEASNGKSKVKILSKLLSKVDGAQPLSGGTGTYTPTPEPQVIPTLGSTDEGRVLGTSSENTMPSVKGASLGSVAASSNSSTFVVNPQIFRPRPVMKQPEGKPELFQAGDKVVYPGHGVGILDEVVTKNVGGADHTFYGITILDSKHTKIMVPVSQAHMVGLRKIVSMHQMQEVFEILRRRSTKLDIKAGNGQTWNRRSRDYTIKLKTGSLLEIAEVTRELSFLAKNKELSFGERKMLESAQYLLVSELALVKDRSHEAVLGEIQALMS